MPHKSCFQGNVLTQRFISADPWPTPLCDGTQSIVFSPPLCTSVHFACPYLLSAHVQLILRGDVKYPHQPIVAKEKEKEKKRKEILVFICLLGSYKSSLRQAAGRHVACTRCKHIKIREELNNQVKTETELNFIFGFRLRVRKRLSLLFIFGQE